MINWEKRREEICLIIYGCGEQWICNRELKSLTEIISQEQTMLHQLEADKAELLEVVKARLKTVETEIDEAVEENFGYSPDFKWFDNLLIERDNLNQLIQKMEEK
jgi:frataxin-like iron-binding protein CyaY